MDQTITIGTLIHGTLQERDLLPAFADELVRVRASDTEHAVLIDDARHPEVFTTDTYTAADIVNDLQDALQEYAPSHMYFGAHEGDGADFGWWPVTEYDCETVTLDAENVIDIECNIHIHTNDHGNVTVSELRGKEIWSAV
tara:strand:- start:70 stop:492 length:423 start_codon:yes stop_codon:yes gene_type:complete